MPASVILDESFFFDAPTRILVVDDDPLLRESAQMYMSMRGAQVETAPDGTAAIEMLCKREYDLAVVDIEMPGLNGLDLVARMQAHATLHRLPVIILSVRKDEKAINGAYMGGVTSYVTKPVDWPTFSHHLQQIVRNNRMARLVGQAPGPAR